MTPSGPVPLADYLHIGNGDSALLFLHGLGGDQTNWQPQIEELSPSFDCLAWTMPGYGDSAPLDAFTWASLSDAVIRVLDDASVEQATIVGLSMGGYIAQQVAVDHGDRVAGLVLAATSDRFGPGSSRFSEEFLATRLAPLDQGRTPADLAPTVVPELLTAGAAQATIDNCVASMSRITTEAYRRALELLVTWDISDRLHEISVPTLCLAGSHDRTAPVKAVERLADGIIGARLEIIDSAHHLMNLDRPEAFNRLIASFAPVA